MIKVVSSLIDSIDYDIDSQILLIKFKKGGQTYRYDNVTKELYDNLLVAESIGRFFLSKIRREFVGTKV